MLVGQLLCWAVVPPTSRSPTDRAPSMVGPAFLRRPRCISRPPCRCPLGVTGRAIRSQGGGQTDRVKGGQTERPVTQEGASSPVLASATYERSSWAIRPSTGDLLPDGGRRGCPLKRWPSGWMPAQAWPIACLEYCSPLLIQFFIIRVCQMRLQRSHEGAFDAQDPLAGEDYQCSITSQTISTRWSPMQREAL